MYVSVGWNESALHALLHMQPKCYSTHIPRESVFKNCRQLLIYNPLMVLVAVMKMAMAILAIITLLEGGGCAGCGSGDSGTAPLVHCSS